MVLVSSEEANRKFLYCLENLLFLLNFLWISYGVCAWVDWVKMVHKDGQRDNRGEVEEPYVIKYLPSAIYYNTWAKDTFGQIEHIVQWDRRVGCILSRDALQYSFLSS